MLECFEKPLRRNAQFARPEWKLNTLMVLRTC